ncbi:MAG: DUF4339 domain-containing protein [Verrucomicrobiales bacterium]|nr:DUF4339 domain-containing protein [Verrucomicrobiales bacterium]
MYRVKGADGKDYGPVDADHIRLWSREGRLNRHSLLQREGEVEWKAVEQFPEFADLVAAPAIPVPPSMGLPSGGGTEAAQSAVKAPAILMIVAAALSLLHALYSLVIIFQMPMDDILRQAEKQMGQPFPVQVPVAFMKTAMVATGALPIVAAIITLIAGQRFLSLRSRGLVMTGGILLLLPCCGVSGPVCLLGMPVGIWSLVVVSKPEIRSAFR